jgi:ELWxxDGT repeat protein
LFFTAEDGVTGRELWTSDGTSDGTFLVTDLFPGEQGSGASLLGFDGRFLFFRGNNGVVGSELWRVDAITVFVEGGDDSIPAYVELSPVYPNPFQSGAQFDLRTSVSERIRVDVYDILGRQLVRLADEFIPAGVSRTVRLNGSRWTPGVYFVRIEGESFSVTRSVVRIR